MTQFFKISIFTAFRKNGIKMNRLDIFLCDLRRMSSNTLVNHIYKNEGDLRHTFEHLVLHSVIPFMQRLIYSKCKRRENLP